MPMDCDLIIDVIYMVGMSLVAAANFWIVYNKYRQCLKHLEDCESPATVKNDIANLTFDAMYAIAWGVFAGISIAGVAKDLKWIAAALLTCLIGFIGLLSVRPLRQLTQRSHARRQAS